jgi:hypothetical protein
VTTSSTFPSFPKILSRFSTPAISNLVTVPMNG